MVEDFEAATRSERATVSRNKCDAWLKFCDVVVRYESDYGVETIGR